MDNDIKPDQYKVVTVGESGVGKTSIVRRFAEGVFEENMPSTIGAAYVKVSVNVDNTSVLLNVWDTAGQERFQSLIPLYLRSANACLVVTDISSGSYLQQLENITQNLKAIMPENVNLIVVGNKRDKVPSDFDFSPLIDWAAKNKMSYSIVSAKTGENIDFLFKEVALTVLKGIKDVQEDTSSHSLVSSESRPSSSCC